MLKDIAAWEETKIKDHATKYGNYVALDVKEADLAADGAYEGASWAREEIACMIEQKFCGIGLEVDIAKAVREWGY